MNYSYAVENSPTACKLEIGGDTTLVRHCRVSQEILQRAGDAAIELYQSSEVFPEQDSLNLPTPFIAEVSRLVSTGFSERLEEELELGKYGEGDTTEETLLRRGLLGTSSYFTTNKNAWKKYPDTDFTDSDVVGAFLTLVSAQATVKIAKSEIQKTGGGDTPSLLADGWYSQKVLKGIALALRDAQVDCAPIPTLQSLYGIERYERVGEAIKNVLGISLSDAALHGLLLAKWNKTIYLEAASSSGQQKWANDAKEALRAVSSETDNYNIAVKV